MDIEASPIVGAETKPRALDPNNGFGTRLEAARKHRGFSRKELAQRLGVSTQTVWHWETKGRHPHGGICSRR